MITLSVSSLKPALAGLAKVVSTKATLECLRCVRVDTTSESVSLHGTDLDMYAKVAFPTATWEKPESFLIPLDRLQSMVRRLPSEALIYLEEGKISCDLGSGRVSENVESPIAREFPEEPAFNGKPVTMPDSFSRRFTEAMGCSSTDSTRYVLNGIQLDTSDPASHYLVGTDGRHLFSANSFELPIAESLTIPNHKLLLWRGLTDAPWAVAGQKKEELSTVRITAGDWTLTMKTIEGTYPNWRQVIPKSQEHRTTVTLPDHHEFSKLVNALPGGELKDKPVDLVIERNSVSVQAITGGPCIPLTGAKASGADLTIRVNRDYLIKAFAYGLTHIAMINAMSPMHFTHEGRQMVVMPLRHTHETSPPTADTSPAPNEPQPETTMTETTKPINGATSSPNRAESPTAVPSMVEKPPIESAIEKLDAFKVTFREALTSITELNAMLRQAVRDQKASEKEVQSVRQTLRTLQGLKI